MGFNPIKMVRKALRSNSLLVKVAAAFLIFWLFGHFAGAVGLEGFGSGDTLTYFHMNGFPHCTKFNPEWDKFTSGTKVKTNKVEAKDVPSKFNIDGYPTIAVVSGGNLGKKYTGARTVAGLKAFTGE